MSKQLEQKTSAELAEMGIRRVINRKPHGMSTDGPTNGKKLGTVFVGEIITAYNKLMRLADGKVSRGGEDYPVTLSDTQIEWLEDKCASMHEATFTALKNKVRPKAIIDSMPD